MSRPVGPICCACEVEMRPERNGVVVVTYFADPPRVYETYNADRWKCPKCGVKVAVGFSERETAVWFDTPRMERALIEADRTPGNRVDCYER